MLVTKYEAGIIVFQIETLESRSFVYLLEYFWTLWKKRSSDPEVYKLWSKIFLYLLSYHAIVFS